MKIPLHLQMFAEGGEGGSAAAGSAAGMTAATSADNAETSLANVQYGKQPGATSAPNPSGEAKAQDAGNPAVDRAEAFEKLIKGEYKDEFAQRTQQIIDNRFKRTKALERQQEALRPVLEALGSKYGLDMSNPDSLGKLQDAVANDESYFEEEAERRGLTVAQLREQKTMERENARMREALEERQRQEARDNVYASWLREGEQLKRLYPGFDLNNEVKSETGDSFLRLLQNGVDMKTAYEVIHKDELLSGAIQYAVQTTQKRTADTIRAQGLRPRESGSGKSAAVQTVKSDPSKWAPSDMDEVLRRVKNGEKIYL